MPRSVGHRYVLRLDVARYFDSIFHEVVLHRLGRVVMDDGILWLCSRILDAARLPQVPEPGRGLPIGNLTSQFWANVVLDAADQLAVAEHPQLPWLRYMDDMLAFGDDKAELWRLAADVRALLREELGLSLKERATLVAPVVEGFPWLGFRVWPRHVRIGRGARRRFGRKLRASMRRAARDDTEENAEAARAATLCEHLRQGDTAALRRDVLRRLRDVGGGG